jgi:hypothetical protein
MEDLRLAVHRTIVVVDVEGFGDRRRTNRDQVAVRDVEAYRFRRQLYYATCAILVSIPSSYSEGVRYPSPF